MKKYITKYMTRGKYLWVPHILMDEVECDPDNIRQHDCRACGSQMESGRCQCTFVFEPWSTCPNLIGALPKTFICGLADGHGGSHMVHLTYLVKNKKKETIRTKEFTHFSWD